MYQINKIKAYREEIDTIGYLADVYSDIAQARLTRVRAGIERNRKFVAEIAQVLHVVRVMAEQKGLSASRRKKISASLVLTSNRRFYAGGLDGRVVEFYMAHTAYTGFVDRFVVGSVGVDILTGRKYPFPFERLIFKNDVPNEQELGELAKKLAAYQKVFVYYPRFMTVLIQQPNFIDITGLVSATASASGDNYYILEPEIGKILDFFEEQIMGILIEQAFLEAELSRIGSQFVTMDNAAINARRAIAQQDILMASARRANLSLQVLETATNLHNYDQEFRTDF